MPRVESEAFRNFGGWAIRLTVAKPLADPLKQDWTSSFNIGSASGQRAFCANDWLRHMPEESTRSFLERRERELANRLELAVANVEQLRTELDEVKCAKGALNPIDAQNLTSNPNFVGRQISAALHDHLSVAASNGVQDQLGCPLAGGPLSPYALASIKELVVRALKSKRQFRFYGASASDIRDFIKDAFGRDIERTSLSPQLSRLRDEGILKLSNDGKWTLATDSKNEAPHEDNTDGAPESPDVGG